MEIVPHSVTDYFPTLLEVFPTSSLNFVLIGSLFSLLLVNNSLFIEYRVIRAQPTSARSNSCVFLNKFRFYFDR